MLSTKAYLSPLPYKRKPVISKMGGGLNNGLPPFDLADNEATEMKNLGSYKIPALYPRLPREDYAQALTGPIRHFGKRETDHVTAVDNNVWKYSTGAGWTTIGTVGTGNADSVDFLGKTTLVNGGTDGYTWDGSTFASIGAFPDNAEYMAVHSNRLYLASSANNVMNVSAFRDISDWTPGEGDADAFAIDVETADGGNATGLVAFANHIVYFKKRSMHELYGTGPINYSFRTISDIVGCVSHRSIKEVKGLLFFMSEDGVRAYNGGTVPQNVISFNIQKYIDNMDTTRFDEVVAGTDDERYFVVVPQKDATKVLLTYDVRFQRWYEEDNVDIIEFVEFDGDIYGMQSNGQAKKIQEPDGSEVIEWFWISKPFNEGTLSGKKFYSKILVIADIPTGATLSVGLSTDAEGDTFTTVKTITADANIQRGKILIPLPNGRFIDWLRVKLSGSGNVTVHSMERQLRIMPDSY